MIIRRVAFTLIGELVIEGVVFLINPQLLIPIGIIALIILIILATYGDKWLKRIFNYLCGLALRKCPNINQLKSELSQEQTNYIRSQQELNQIKDNLSYIMTKILVPSESSRELFVAEDLAEHRIHISLTFNNILGFHIEIESIVPKILVDDWELGGNCQVSSSWVNINSCQIEIDQSISPTVANGLRQKEENEITVGYDLVLNIWIKDANIRSEVRYSFAV